MYRVKMVIGLKSPHSRRANGRPTHSKLVGAITVQKKMDEEFGEVVPINDALGMTKNLSDEAIKGETVWIRDLEFPKVFLELRKKFNSSVVNTNADIEISIGSMDCDYIEEILSREEYMRVKDSELINYFMQRVKATPQIREFI